MITEKDTIKCEAIFNDDKSHRLLWKRVWQKEKPLACVIMLNPCHADTVVTDVTTALVVNNIASLEEYGGVSIVNLFSILTTKLDFRHTRECDFNDYQNDKYIKLAAEEASTVILAWGKSAETNAKIYHRAEQVMDLLRSEKDKLRVISDGNRLGIHPLCPSVRAMWVLTEIDGWLKQTKEATKKLELQNENKRRNAPQTYK